MKRTAPLSRNTWIGRRTKAMERRRQIAPWSDPDVRFVSVEDRFLADIEIGPDDECWIWHGPKSQGYGRFYIGAQPVLAHRYMYELVVGRLPRELVLDHTCNNRPCINPRHLDPVPQAENARRYSKRQTTCRRGHPWLPETTRLVNKGAGRICLICYEARGYRGVKRTWRDRYRDHMRAAVKKRAAGICEACGSMQSEPDWAHLFARGHIIAEPWASTPELTMGLCHTCHDAIDRARDLALRDRLRWRGLRRLALRFNHFIVDPPDDPIDAVRRAVDELSASWDFDMETLKFSRKEAA